MTGVKDDMKPLRRKYRRLEQITGLKDDMKSLRRKYRRLEKEITGLKDAMKPLRRKYRRLDEAVGKSGGAVGQPGPSALPATLPSPLLAVLPRDDRAALEASVAHLGRDSVKAIINMVAQKLFTGQELETHSLTGKSGEVVLYPLDSVRLDLLEQLARSKCPELTHKLFVETLQKLQKVIRKKTILAVLKTDVA